MSPSLLLLLALAPAATVVECPASIEISQRADDLPEGWAALDPDRSHRLTGAEIFHGAPEDRATLLADDESGEGADWISRYRLNPSPVAYRLVCDYEATRLRLVRLLPERLSECRVVRDRAQRFTGGGVREVSCR